MPTILIPTPLRNLTASQATVSVEAQTVRGALDALVATHPGLRNNLFDKEGKLRSFVNLYLNDEDIRYLSEGEATPVKATDELTIIPSIAGGCELSSAR